MNKPSLIKQDRAENDTAAWIGIGIVGFMCMSAIILFYGFSS